MHDLGVHSTEKGEIAQEKGTCVHTVTSSVCRKERPWETSRFSSLASFRVSLFLSIKHFFSGSGDSFFAECCPFFLNHVYGELF